MATESKPTRAEEVRRERRRKPGTVGLPGLKLMVDEDKLDRKTNHYRFVRDEGNRVQQLMAQDYTVVKAPDAKPDGIGLGSVPTAHGGYADSGKPYGMVLMEKPKDWHEADQKEKQRPLDEMEAAMKRGADNPNLPLRGPGVYTPDAGNSIETI